MKNNITVEVSSLETVRPDQPVRLLIEGVRRGRGSFAIRVFLEQPDADAETPLEGNPRYAGTIYLYGHGQSDAMPEAFPERAARQRVPYDQFLDVTNQLRELKTGATIAVTLVPVDLKGHSVKLDLVEFQRVVLVPGE